MMRHPFLVEDICRRQMAERLAAANRDALVDEAAVTAQRPRRPGLRLQAVRLLHALIALV